MCVNDSEAWAEPETGTEVQVLRVELALLSSMVSTMFFSLLSLIELIDLDSIESDAVEPWEKFLQQVVIVKKMEQIWFQYRGI